MRTLLDYIGLNPLRPLVAFGGDDSGGGGGGDREESGTSAADAYSQYADTMTAGGGGTNMSGSNAMSYEEMEALAGNDRDPTPTPVVETGPSGYVSLDAMANTAVQSDPNTSFSYGGETYDNVFDYHDAIFGDDDDDSAPAPAPEPVAQPVASATSDLNVAPVVDYSDIDLGGLPLLPQEIPVEYRDTTSGIEKVVDFYSPPEFDLTDPNEPLVQDGKPFSGIAYGDLYESGQPVGSVSMDNIAGLGELELPDLSLTPATATTDLSALPAIESAIEPEQTGLEAFEEQQYLSYDPSTVPDYELGLSPEELSDVLTRADAYYGDTGYETDVKGAPSSEPLSVAEQVAQYDSDVNLDTLDAERELASSTVDPFVSSLTDDDMGLPDISVDEAMFTRGDLGQSDVVGGASIPLDPLGLATGDPMDPYSATLADDVVDEVVDSTLVPDIELPDNKEIIDKVVAGVLTGTPVEGFDVLTSKVGMPKTGIQGTINDILGSFALFSGLATGDSEKRQEIADMLSSGSGRAVYNSSGELIGAVYNATGEYVGYPSNDGGYIRTDDGQLIKSGVDVPEYPDPFVGSQDDDGCPAGYVFDPAVGQCVPIEESAASDPKISLREVNRPTSPIVGIPEIPSDPVEAMTIRAPKQFAMGGPVDLDPNTYDFRGFDADNPFDLNSILAMQKHQVGLKPLDESQMQLYDLNRDGVVDMTDTVAGLQYINYSPDGVFDEQRANAENFYLYSPKISLGVRPTQQPVEQPVEQPVQQPVQGMAIRQPKQFNRGGPVTPNIDRFLSSLRG